MQYKVQQAHGCAHSTSATEPSVPRCTLVARTSCTLRSSPLQLHRASLGSPDMTAVPCTHTGAQLGPSLPRRVPGHASCSVEPERNALPGSGDDQMMFVLKTNQNLAPRHTAIHPREVFLAHSRARSVAAASPLLPADISGTRLPRVRGGFRRTAWQLLKACHPAWARGPSLGVCVSVPHRFLPAHVCASGFERSAWTPCIC